MSKIKAASLAVALMLTSASIVAAPNTSHKYVGLDHGSAEMSTADGSESPVDANMRAYLGYQLNQYFAIEGGLSLFELEDTVGNVADLTGFDVSVLARLPVTQKLAAYARLGYWDWDVSASFGGSYYELFGDSDMLYGIGLEYNVSPRFKLRLDATRWDTAEAEIDTINASIAFKY